MTYFPYNTFEFINMGFKLVTSHHFSWYLHVVPYEYLGRGWFVTTHKKWNRITLSFNLSKIGVELEILHQSCKKNFMQDNKGDVWEFMLKPKIPQKGSRLPQKNYGSATLRNYLFLVLLVVAWEDWCLWVLYFSESLIKQEKWRLIVVKSSDQKS